MVHGRDGELAQIDDLLGGATAGRGGALLLLGEAGIGKSALLRAAAERAAARGMAVVSGHAVQAERDVAFAALGALLGDDDSAPLEERLARRAAERPLLVLIDDVQWLDEASLTALAFAARRLDGARVALLFAGRAEPDRGLTARGVAVVDGLHGLDDAAARRVLGDGLAPEPCRHVLDAARGNPLALRELAAALTAPSARAPRRSQSRCARAPRRGACSPPSWPRSPPTRGRSCSSSPPRRS